MDKSTPNATTVFFRQFRGAGPWAVAALLWLAALPGCKSSESSADQAQAGPPVTVSVPIERTVTDYEDYTGRTDAIQSLQVQARVTGYLDKVYFKEGSEVAAGAVLYEIDPRPYQDQLDAAKAQLAVNKAALNLAKANNARFKALFKTSPGAVSQLELDQYQAQEEQALANVDLAKANVATAELNLTWTKVTTPISGLISRTLITLGNLVTANVTLLTTVVSVDPMYAYFDVDEPTMLRVHRLINEGKFKSAREGASIPVLVFLSNGERYPHEGTVDFVNNRVDPATGTLQIRGVLPNPKPKIGERGLTPGMFVRVRVAIGAPYKALLVSPRALAEDQALKYVFVVNKKNEVVRQQVTVGQDQEGLQIITDGLQPDQLVIVNGLQRVRPGMIVKPKTVEMPRSTESSPAIVPTAELKSPPPGK